MVVPAPLLLQAAVTVAAAMASKRAGMDMVAPSDCFGQPTWTAIVGYPLAPLGSGGAMAAVCV
jgi:hypothetical protein